MGDAVVIGGVGTIEDGEGVRAQRKGLQLGELGELVCAHKERRARDGVNFDATLGWIRAERQDDAPKREDGRDVERRAEEVRQGPVARRRNEGGCGEGDRR